MMHEPSGNVERRSRSIFDWFKPAVPARRMGFALFVVSMIFVLLVTGGTTVYAAQQSLPDDVLYPVKIGTEKIQLAFTLTPKSRANLHLKLAERRVDEVVAQSTLGRTMSTSALENVAAQTDAAISEIASLPSEDTRSFASELSQFTLNQQVVLGQVSEIIPEEAQPALTQARDAAKRGNLIAKVAYSNPDYLEKSPSVSDAALEENYFEIEGTLISVEGGQWNIGGLLLENVSSSQANPPLGTVVSVEGLIRGDRTFVSRIKYKKELTNRVKLEGILQSASSNQTSLCIGGIPVDGPQDAVSLSHGEHLELVGTTEKGVFIAEDVGSKQSHDGRIEIKGTLVEVHLAEGIIVVEDTGARVDVNVDEALINSEDGQQLILSDLESLLGMDIRVDILSMKKGILSAKEVYINIEQETETSENEDDKNEGNDRDIDEDMSNDEGDDEDKGRDDDKGKGRDRGKNEDDSGDKGKANSANQTDVEDV